MELNELLTELQKLSDRGYGDTKVELLCCDDNPISDGGIEINGVFVIDNHPKREINGIYIDGTV